MIINGTSMSFYLFTFAGSLNISRVMRMCLFPYAKTKAQISSADQCLWFRYIDSTILLRPKSEISSLWTTSVVDSPVCA